MQIRIPESNSRIFEMHQAFSHAREQVWTEEILWTWQWWLLVLLLILPWLIWMRLVNKRRLTEICLLGMFVMATVTWMDELGTELLLWYYPYKIIPYYPQLVPINYSVLPVTFMLIYQYASNWHLYALALTAMAALFSWVAEPILEYFGIYQVLTWKFSYSFPIYILIGISHRWLLELILSIARKQQRR